MPTNETVQYDVIATVNEAITNMRLLAKETNAATRAMAAELGGQLPKAADAASKSHVGLLDTLKGFAREQRQQGKVSRFYAGEVMSLVPAAEGAKGSLQGLLGVFVEAAASGSKLLAPMALLGVGFEALKFGVEQFTAAQTEATKKAAEHRDQLIAIANAFEQYRRAAQGASQTELTFLDVTKKDRDALFQAQKELGLVNEKLGVMRERGQVLAMGGLLGKRDELQKDISALKNRIELARAAKEEADKISQAGAVPAIKKADADAAIARTREYETQLAAVTARGVEGRRQIIAEGEQKIAEVRKKYATAVGPEADAEKGRLIAAEQSATARRLRQLDLDIDVAATKRAEDEKFKAMAEAQKRGDELVKQTKEQRSKDLAFEVGETKRAEDEKIREKLEAQKRGDEILKQQRAERSRDADEQIAQAERIGDALGGALASAKSEADIFKAALMSSVSVIRDIAMQTIRAAAAKAAAEAAASQAGIPIIGPFLAAGAAAATFALVSGFINSFGVGTWKVPSDQLAMVHKGEIITPAPMSDAIRSGKATLGAGGAGAGDTYNFTIHAFDGPDVERALIRLRNRLARNGRW